MNINCKLIMSNDVPFIQQLLIAEKNAKEVVDAARKRNVVKYFI